jgi:hypothetical protein
MISRSEITWREQLLILGVIGVLCDQFRNAFAAANVYDLLSPGTGYVILLPELVILVSVYLVSREI